MTNRKSQNPQTPRLVGVTAAFCAEHLPDANWADAYEIETQRTFTDMRSLAEQTIGAMPWWARGLLWLRNLILAPFGLNADGVNDVHSGAVHVDIFPVLRVTEDQIVVGLEDWHLNFRIVVDRYRASKTCRLGATTLIQRHNVFGRLYIAIIAPFHRLIVKSVLKNAL